MMDIHTNAGLQWVGKVAAIFLDGNHVLEGTTTLHTGGRMKSGRQMQLGGRNNRQKHLPLQLPLSIPQ